MDSIEKLVNILLSYNHLYYVILKFK